jgi:DNA-binding HxlR family transcriptional regulator
VDDYGQFCPVAQASQILVRRWMPLVVRELLCGSRRFNDIHRGVPRMSRTLLTRRLDELEHAGLLERRRPVDGSHVEYHLTTAGKALRPVILQLGEWGKRWLPADPAAESLDGNLLMWDLQRRVDTARLPARRRNVRFRFAHAPKGQSDYWLLLAQDTVDLCLKDPGHEVDLTVNTDLATMTRIWLGDLGLGRALRDGRVRLDGPRELQRQLPSWLGLSLFAGIPRQG